MADQEAITLNFDPIPEGWIAYDAVAVIKCMDTHGNQQLCIRQTGSVAGWEAIGMFRIAEQTTTLELLAHFEPPPGNRNDPND